MSSSTELGHALNYELNFFANHDYHSNIKYIKWLVDLGADLEVRDEYGDTPLTCEHRSGSRSRQQVLSILLTAGADANCRSNKPRMITPLMYARRKVTYIQLIEAGADVQLMTVDIPGENAIHFFHIRLKNPHSKIEDTFILDILLNSF